MAKNYAGKHLSKKAEKPISKAGVMMFEDTPDGRKLLVAYNEGRFAKNGRYFVLPKGSVDDGESVVRAGLREFSEETGVPLVTIPERLVDGVKLPAIEGILSEDNVRALERGETLQHITNPRFPGFMVEQFNPTPFLHDYHARSGSTNKMAMFGVKVTGLDSIKPLLKNSDGKTTKDFLDGNKAIPRFSTFWEWMKQGYIPADGNLPPVALCDAEWFAEKVTRYAPKGIEVAGEAKPDWQKKTRDNWQKFCKAMEKDKGYKQLRLAFHAIKERMIAKGFVQGDNALLKFDEKDCPLFWYTEGGAIDYARPILAKTFVDMDTNRDYARAFGGEGTKSRHLGKANKRALGQVAGYAPFVSDEEWRGASIDAYGEVKPVVYTLGRVRGHFSSPESREATPAQARA